MILFFRELRENLHLLTPNHHHFITKILKINSFEKSKLVIEEFQLFLVDLMTIENRYSKSIIANLVQFWIPEGMIKKFSYHAVE